MNTSQIAYLLYYRSPQSPQITILFTESRFWISKSEMASMLGIREDRLQKQIERFCKNKGMDDKIMSLYLPIPRFNTITHDKCFPGSFAVQIGMCIKPEVAEKFHKWMDNQLSNLN